MEVAWAEAALVASRQVEPAVLQVQQVLLRSRERGAKRLLEARQVRQRSREPGGCRRQVLVVRRAAECRVWAEAARAEVAWAEVAWAGSRQVEQVELRVQQVLLRSREPEAKRLLAARQVRQHSRELAGCRWQELVVSRAVECRA